MTMTTTRRDPLDEIAPGNPRGMEEWTPLDAKRICEVLAAVKRGEVELSKRSKASLGVLYRELAEVLDREKPGRRGSR